MDEKKISFIMCTNNEYYMRECRLYLDELVIPEGYEVNVVEVTGAKSMAAGYNEGMARTDAKYKIYMHQDVFLIHKSFLLDLLAVFQQDPSIGMAGMVGTPYLIKNGTMWQGVRFGFFYRLKELIQRDLAHRFYPFDEGYMEMEAVDGLLMATQYDLPWREDLFQRWDFYDVSQSFEFLKAGYKVVVPSQNPEWYIHDCGALNLDNYSRERKKFLENYAEYMEGRQDETWEDYLEQVRQKVLKGFHGSEAERERLLQLLNGLADE